MSENRKQRIPLAVSHPHLVEEWFRGEDPNDTPYTVTAGSHKKVTWKCRRGHLWEALVYNRAKAKGTGCPCCSGRKPIPGETDLVTVNPSLAFEWHPEKNGEARPEQYTSGSNKRVVWLCPKCGCDWKATINNRSAGTGCPYCSGKKPIPGVTDLVTVNPALASEWHPERNGEERPEQFTAGSSKRAWWLCPECGFEWPASIDHRNRGNGCRRCAGKEPIPGVTDLVTVNPALVSEWHPERNGEERPEQFTAGSSKSAWWLCPKCGCDWEAVICDRSHGNGCPYCAGRRPIPGKTDLATVNPKLAADWDPERNEKLPKDYTAHSSEIVWWRCELGHHWEASIAHRSDGESCPFCSNKQVIPGFNDLATTRPDLAAEWHPSKNEKKGLMPTNVTAGSGRVAWWLCRLGHDWPAVIKSRSQGRGCPYCAGRLVLSGFNDLATKRPDLADEWDPLGNGDKVPSNYTIGSNKVVWWRCGLGHKWKEKIAYRSLGARCPTCSMEMQTSFPEQAVYWYLSNNLDEEVLNRERVELDGKAMEVDVFLPRRKIGIEYDGEYWHRDREEQDREKDRLLRDAGIRLVRIKEGSENFVDGDIISYDCHNDCNTNLTWAIRQVLVLVTGRSDVHDEIDVKRDYSAINQSYVHSVKKRSIAVTHPQLVAEWDYEGNGSITPDTVTAGSHKEVSWKCQNGHVWSALVYNRAKPNGTGCPRCQQNKRMRISGRADTTNDNEQIVDSESDDQSAFLD